MCVAPSNVPEVGQDAMDTPVNNFLLPRGFICFPHPAIAHATTLRVAVGSDKLHEGRTTCQ